MRLSFITKVMIFLIGIYVGRNVIFILFEINIYKNVLNVSVPSISKKYVSVKTTNCFGMGNYVA